MALDMPGPLAFPAATALPVAAATTLVFTMDRDSEGVMRQCLSDLLVASPVFKNGNVDDAITELATRSSPRLLVVDVQGADDPIARVQALANVCDPATGVIVIGEANDIRLYRDLKAAGVVEYFYKPLVRALIAQTCSNIINGSTARPISRTGKLVLVVGVRGGSGATAIAVATAWHLAEVNKRRVCLLDLDLQFGDAALQLNAKPSHALREALDHPELVDELFLDRGMARVGERMGVIAALEALEELLVPQEDAVLLLLERLLARNRYVFVDIPMTSVPGLSRILHLPGTTLLIGTGSLVSARDAARLRKKLGPNSAERTTIHVLNKAGASESLSIQEFERAAGASPEIVIPYAREIAAASRLGGTAMHQCAILQRSLAPLYRQLSGEELVVKSKWSLSGLFGNS
jgi:pilus assembly protein CpaE